MFHYGCAHRCAGKLYMCLSLCLLCCVYLVFVHFLRNRCAGVCFGTKMKVIEDVGVVSDIASDSVLGTPMQVTD